MSLTLVKKKPMGDIIPMAFCSMGRSLVEILDWRLVKYWTKGDWCAVGTCFLWGVDMVASEISQY